MTVERADGVHDDLPDARVRRCFAGEVSGVELGDRGPDVLGVERDGCHTPLVGAYLCDAEEFGMECVGAPVSTRVASAKKGETVPTNRDDV